MISWKHSFRRLGEEFDVAKRKKQALDNLLAKGRISQGTYEVFNSEIEEAIMDIEKQQRALQEKMTAKSEEIQAQIRTLETLLANFEIQHVTGEVDDAVYESQVNLLSVGLDSARAELDTVKEAMNQLTSGAAISIDSEDIEEPKADLEVVEMPVVTLKEKMPEMTEETTEATGDDGAETMEAEIEAEPKEET